MYLDLRLVPGGRRRRRRGQAHSSPAPRRARALAGGSRGALCRRRAGAGCAWSRPVVRRSGSNRGDFPAACSTGCAMDVRRPTCAGPRHGGTLDLYCDRVASAVGRLSVNPIFGMERRRQPRLSLIISAGRCSSPTSCATSTRMPALGRALPAARGAGGRRHRQPRSRSRSPPIHALAKACEPVISPGAGTHSAEAAAVVARRPGRRPRWRRG